MTTATYRHVQLVEGVLERKFPYFAKVIQKRHEEFGDTWLARFDRELATFFGNDEARLEAAVRGYGNFALDGMRLQKKFDKAREYIPKRYADVSEAVYQNRSYMFDLYLPGILLSQYLWPHHYRQLLYFEGSFVPLVSEASLFFDVGVGTGFYSKEMLRLAPRITGIGIDISPFSLEHTRGLVDAWRLGDRYRTVRCDIFVDPPAERADCLINVEVLEHLEETVRFLRGLRELIRPGGHAFITAAVNGPNADHIYLYRNVAELEAEVVAAGFRVLDRQEYFGYVPKPGETAPSNAICIVERPA
jgi:SAM-dependent methyltransferase